MKTRFTIVILLAIAFLSLLYKYGHAFQTTVWRASNTATADTLQNLCPEINPGTAAGSGSGGSVRGVYHGICVNSASPAGGSVQVFNSSAAASNIISTVQTSTTSPCNFYDVGVSSGLTYTKTGTADVTILFQCY